MNEYCLVLVFVVVVEHLLKGKRMNFLRSKDTFAAMYSNLRKSKETSGAALTRHTTTHFQVRKVLSHLLRGKVQCFRDAVMSV